MTEPAPQGEDLRAASRALKDALANLSRSLTQGLSGVSSDITREVVEDLNDASLVLAQGLGTRTRRGSRADNTRADLIAAATRVFAEKGYEAATVADLAAAAGYTKGALYAHFDSKEALFLAVIGSGQSTACDQDWSGMDPIPLASADQLADVMLSLEAYLYALRHPEGRAEFMPLARDSLNAISALFHRQRTGQSIDTMTQADRDTAMALVAMYTMGSIMTQILPEDMDVPGAMRRMAEVLIAANET